jgi:hypothetical protein
LEKEGAPEITKIAFVKGSKFGIQSCDNAGESGELEDAKALNGVEERGLVGGEIQ